MKSAKSLYIALFAVSLLVAGNVTVRARTTEQAGDQAKGDSSTAAKSGKKKCRWRGHAKEKQFKELRRIKRGSCSCQQTPRRSRRAGQHSACCPANLGSAQTPRVNSAGMVWVNTDSGVYHKPGTRWYGKTKLGKYMTEADAPKASYRPAAAAAPQKKLN